MKNPLIVAILLLTSALTKAEDAAVPAVPASAPEAEARPGAGPLRQHLLRQFDADQNGKLSADERAIAKAALKEKGSEWRAKVTAHFDADKDGTLSGSERETLKATIKARRGKQAGGGAEEKAGQKHRQLLNHFDEDKDGQLSEAERAKAREARKKRTGA